MIGHVYSSSFFWSGAAEVSDLAQFASPFALFIGCMLWAIRCKSWQSLIGLVGGLLILGSHLSHGITTNLHFVSLGKEVQPVQDQSGILTFLFLYGMPLGLLTIGIALVAQHALPSPRKQA